MFSFCDLLEEPAIQALDAKSKLHQVLQLFCYGQYKDMKAATIPDLTPTQIRKLRQLTIISACDSQHFISYDVLLKSLELTSLRELEDLIIELFYLEAVFGKLDQQKRILVVESAIGRDLRREDVSSLFFF